MRNPRGGSRALAGRHHRRLVGHGDRPQRRSDAGGDGHGDPDHDRHPVCDRHRRGGRLQDVQRQGRRSPYEVVASLSGFKTQTVDNVAVRLGDDTNLEIQLQLEAATGEIVVVSESSPLISPTKMGVGSSVSDNTIMAMPSVERNIYDSARTNPVFSTPSADDGLHGPVGGRPQPALQQHLDRRRGQQRRLRSRRHRHPGRPVRRPSRSSSTRSRSCSS